MGCCSHSHHTDGLRVVKGRAQGCEETKAHRQHSDQASGLPHSTTAGSLPHPGSGLTNPFPGLSILCPSWHLTPLLPALAPSSLNPLPSQTTGAHAQPSPSSQEVSSITWFCFSRPPLSAAPTSQQADTLKSVPCSKLHVHPSKIPQPILMVVLASFCSQPLKCGLNPAVSSALCHSRYQLPRTLSREVLLSKVT